MKVAIIPRDPSHSPNMESNDVEILAAVAKELEKAGATVTWLKQGEFPGDGTDIVCHMSRTTAILEILERAVQCGITIINSPAGVRHCSRSIFVTLLEENGIPQPQYTVVKSAKELEALHYPAWIKRADGWSCHAGDVCYAENLTDATVAFSNMQSRGIDACLHCNHIKGDIIKFYGIGEDFFHYCYPDIDHTKFGLEKINGKPQKRRFDTGRLKSIATKAAKAVGVEIYGGDCIVDDDGGIHIIDINDFPSFSAVRENAAKAIAKLIMK